MAYKPSSKYVVVTSSMRASSKGVKRLQLLQLFSVDEGRERIQIPFFSGPSSARQRNAIQMALCPFAGGLIMAAGIVSFHHSFGDNPQALASELSYIQVDKHRIVILYHIHQCRPCT